MSFTMFFGMPIRMVDLSGSYLVFVPVAVYVEYFLNNTKVGVTTILLGVRTKMYTCILDQNFWFEHETASTVCFQTASTALTCHRPVDVTHLFSGPTSVSNEYVVSTQHKLRKTTKFAVISYLIARNCGKLCLC